MNTNRLLALAGMLGLVVLPGFGCVPRMTMDEIKAMRPERARELDMLNAFVGEWKTSGTAQIAALEEPVEIEGTNSVKWSPDRTHLIETSFTSMPCMGGGWGTMLWTWDHVDKEFKIFRVDGYPAINTGSARYDRDDGIWRLNVKVRLPQVSGFAKGTIEVVDADTLKWTWTDWTLGGLIEMSKMRGMSTRVR